MLNFVAAESDNKISSFIQKSLKIGKLASKMRGKSIPKSVLKSGVKLPELAKSASIPSDLHKTATAATTTTTATATATVVVSSNGPTPQVSMSQNLLFSSLKLLKNKLERLSTKNSGKYNPSLPKCG